MSKIAPRINRSAKERGARVTKLISMTGLSRKDFCLKYDIGTTTLRQWERPTLKGLTEKGAERLINFAQQESIKCSFEWLYNGNGLPPYFEIETKENNQSTQRRELDNNQQGLLGCNESMTEEIKRFKLGVQNAVIASITDEGLEPSYVKGDIVGGSFDSDADIEKYIDKTCIVYSEENDIFVRKLIKTGDTYSLRILNDDAPKTLAREINNIKIKKISAIYRTWRKKEE